MQITSQLAYRAQESSSGVMHSNLDLNTIDDF